MRLYGQTQMLILINIAQLLDLIRFTFFVPQEKSNWITLSETVRRLRAAQEGSVACWSQSRTCLQSTWSQTPIGSDVEMPVSFPLLWCGERVKWLSAKSRPWEEKWGEALSELVIAGSAVGSLNCSPVAVFMCVCVCVGCEWGALGMYEKTWGWGRVAMKSSALPIQNLLVLFYRRLGTSCTDGNIRFWRKKDACPSHAFHAASFGTDAPCCERGF